MLCFGGAAVLGGANTKRANDVVIKIANRQSSHQDSPLRVRSMSSCSWHPRRREAPHRAAAGHDTPGCTSPHPSAARRRMAPVLMRRNSGPTAVPHGAESQVMRGEGQPPPSRYRPRLGAMVQFHSP